MTGRLDVNCVDIVGIRVKSLVHISNIKNDNSQINRGSTIKINHFFLTLRHLVSLTYMPPFVYLSIIQINIFSKVHKLFIKYVDVQ